jgi:hypothetical protein
MVGLDEKRFKPVWALEIKWSNRYYDRPKELDSLIWFCKKNNLNTALVTTIDKEGVKEFDGVRLQFIPSSVYAFVVGFNTIDRKRQLVEE